MITKDQAIAPTHAELMELFYQMNGSEGLQKLRAFNKFDKAVKQVCEQAQPPAPDCRTCKHYHLTRCLFLEHYQNGCTNGNQYVEAPKVVLWRTE